jgi:uncharacterized protein YecE (DUF72 family)
MEFGRIPVTELDHIDFALPPDAALNAAVLQPGMHVPKIYLGCTQWGRKEWIGKIYPKGMKDTAALDHYVRHFNTVELNATHYQIFGAAVIARWAAKAKGRDFHFCPKVPQSISHYSGFKHTDELTTTFLEGILAFEHHLGPVFMQLSEKYSPDTYDALMKYLRSLPTDLRFFVEVRHPAWFADTTIRDRYFNDLQRLHIGAVITDTAGRRDATHMTLTTPTAFVRYVGNSLHDTDRRRMYDWAVRIKAWIAQGLQELYFFIHTPEEVYAPEMAIAMAAYIEEVCGIRVPRPQLQQTSLF